jgi:hypothetical protein
MMVTNNEPGGSVKLTTQITTGQAKAFSVSGGSCTTVGALHAGASCSYNLALKGLKSYAGKGVNSQLVITGKFTKGACPSGDVLTVSATLAGFVNK